MVFKIASCYVISVHIIYCIYFNFSIFPLIPWKRYFVIKALFPLILILLQGSIFNLFTKVIVSLRQKVFQTNNDRFIRPICDSPLKLTDFEIFEKSAMVRQTSFKSIFQYTYILLTCLININLTLVDRMTKKARHH